MTSILDVPPQVTVLPLGFSTTPSHGARVESPAPTTGNYPPPESVYLIYLTMVGSPPDVKWVARHKAKPKGSDADATALELFNLAKANDPKYKKGENLIDLVWEEPCYLYIVLDITDNEFIDSEAEDYDPIHFHAKKALPVSGPPVYRYYDANYSFYDGKIINIGGRSAFRCANYLKDEQGNDLKHPRLRKYGFEIRFNAAYATGKHPTKIDPDGENQGPPRVAMLEFVAASDVDSEARRSAVKSPELEA